MSTTRSPVTFAAFVQMPDMPGKRDLVDGEVIYSPPAVLRHARLSKRFYALPCAALNADQVWYETGYRIGGGWIQPGESVSWPHQSRDDYLDGGPMLAVEILSPSNTTSRIEGTLTRYFGEGTGEVWGVDDRRKTLTVYRKEGDQIARGHGL